MAQTVNDTSLFIPSTSMFDVTQIKDMDVGSPEFKELIIRLYQGINTQSISINAKDTGLYDTQSYTCGQMYFPAPIAGGASSGTTTPANRAVYRKVVNFGALPNTGTKDVAHGITNIVNTGFSITRFYGAATDPTNRLYLPLPYVAKTADSDIALYADATNVSVDTFAVNRSAFTKVYIIIEYLKD